MIHPRLHRRSFVFPLAIGVLFGCAGTPPTQDTSGDDFRARRAAVEARLTELGVVDNPEVESLRAELEAAEAQQDEDVVVDSLELRTAISDGDGTDVGFRARVPLENLVELPARREASQAEVDAALGKLRAAGLKQHAAQCLPALDQKMVTERARIYERYAERQKSLQAWSLQLQEAGLVDELSAARFELSSLMGLQLRTPTERPATAGLDSAVWAKVLPEPGVGAEQVGIDAELVRQQITLHQPDWHVEKALAQRYRALASVAHTSRLPYLKFFDLTFDTASGGNPSEYGAQVGVEIPFGRTAHAKEQRALALARSHESRSRMVLEDRFRIAKAALYEVRDFELRGKAWMQLLELAERSEQIADRWQRDRLTEPGRISNLLDDVYDARLAVLNERERAGVAGCSLLAATGIPVHAWPRNASNSRKPALLLERTAASVAEMTPSKLPVEAEPPAPE